MSGRVDDKPFLSTWASAAGSGTPFAFRMVMVRVEFILCGSGRGADKHQLKLMKRTAQQHTIFLIYSKLFRCSCRYCLTSRLCPLPKHVSRLVTPNSSTPYTTVLLILVRAEKTYVSIGQHIS